MEAAGQGPGSLTLLSGPTQYGQILAEAQQLHAGPQMAPSFDDSGAQPPLAPQPSWNPLA